MALPDIKALRELLKLLRSQGVLQFQSTDLNLVLSDNFTPESSTKSKSKAEVIDEIMDDEEDPQATIERLIDYSSRPPVEDI